MEFIDPMFCGGYIQFVYRCFYVTVSRKWCNVAVFSMLGISNEDISNWL